MRRVNMMICSVLHLPLAQCAEIEALIANAGRDPETGRLVIDHPVLTIEACRTGYWISTNILTHPQRRRAGRSGSLGPSRNRRPRPLPPDPLRL